jgi:hypothetical protein
VGFGMRTLLTLYIIIRMLQLGPGNSSVAIGAIAHLHPTDIISPIQFHTTLMVTLSRWTGNQSRNIN